MQHQVIGAEWIRSDQMLGAVAAGSCSTPLNWEVSEPVKFELTYQSTNQLADITLTELDALTRERKKQQKTEFVKELQGHR